MNHLTQPIATRSDAPLVFEDQREPALMSYVNRIIEQRWLILGIALAVSLLGTLYAFVAKPVYEANLLIHVEEKGQREPKNILGEAGSMIDFKTPAAAEIELLRSRLVIAQAVDNLRLYIHAEPRRMPLLGKLAADAQLTAYWPRLRGLGGFAWAKESITVNEFSVPDILENRPFQLRVQRQGRYEIFEPDSAIRITGRVGELIHQATAYGPIALEITQLHAYPGTQFSLLRSSRLAVIEQVQQALTINEVGKQSGVVSASLKGDNALEVYQILNQIGQQYMAQNSARRTEQADKSLAYLNQRLPQLKQQLELAEARYNQFRNLHGTVDLGEEAKINLQRTAAARTRRIELEQKRIELLTRFTANHPSVISVDEQLREVNQEIRDAAIQIRTLPVLEQDMVRLARDVKVNSELYAALLASAQQLELITVGKTSNVRLVDVPLKPDRPVTPNRPRIIAVSVFLGVFIGVLAVFIRRALQTTIDDPQQVEALFGLPIYVSIARSKVQTALNEKQDALSRLPLLARVASMDGAIESLRSFRAALQFSMSHARNNIVLITGPTAGLGKSFVSANLAVVMAGSGRKILLIDGDLREGYLHRYFNCSRSNGLADLLSDAQSLEVCVHQNVIENLDFIATGSLPPHPAAASCRTLVASQLANTAG